MLQVATEPKLDIAGLRRVDHELRATDQALRSTPGLRCLRENLRLQDAIDATARSIHRTVSDLEEAIDAGRLIESADVEVANAALLRLKDVCWAIRVDRLTHARAVAALCGASDAASALSAYSAIAIALSGLDRLEVRGRDSCGLHVLVAGHGLNLASDDIKTELAARADPLFRDRAAAARHGTLSFVYKVAREVGELGDNTAALRKTIGADTLLRRAVANPNAAVAVLAHTRWASVGLINEANAHPVQDNTGGRYVVAALNGDVDNHRELIRDNKLAIPVGITTDAQVIPCLITQERVRGASADIAFRRTVSRLDGSVAIACADAEDPSTMRLAVRGSGQALCIGLAEDTYVVASEPYGLVEIASTYVRMDGERACDQHGTRGEIIVLDQRQAGTTEGVMRSTYSGVPVPVDKDSLLTTDITTRDIARGSHSHFLLKEISESPETMRRTLRGRIRETSGRKRVALTRDTIPQHLGERLRDGDITRIIVIGQGTAAVAGTGVAAALHTALSTQKFVITAEPGSELSAFGLRHDMSDTLVIAVTQSGTTTDTNRTVDLAHARGAATIAIVNRRDSDITHKVDGVLYTSDGRDIEMSVASTKAFYSQIAAGWLLGFAIANVCDTSDTSDTALQAQHEILTALASLPSAMDRILALQPRIRVVATEVAPRRRHWAVVGNGLNRIAASEIRIKMSELCYKSIALDVTEDKKHIDLSSEPMTLICAAGLTGSAASDVAKEVDIFAAHRGAPVVIATEGAEEFSRQAHVLHVPPTHPELAYILSTMVGHLFGYEAAVAIDAPAQPLRAIRAVLDEIAQSPGPADAALLKLRTAIAPHIAAFRENLWSGLYDAALSPVRTARLTSLLSYVEGATSLDFYDREFKRVGTPVNLLDDLAAALTVAIDDLSRPVDTIRHQAKTVTVGISRADAEVFANPLVTATLAAGAPQDALTYQTLRTLVALDNAVATVDGSTRYEISGDPRSADAEIRVAAKRGWASDRASRTEDDAALRGTKKMVAMDRTVLVARGRSDNRLVVFVPEVKSGSTTGMTLLHVGLHDRLSAEAARRVLDGYRHRLEALTSAVLETEAYLDEQLLAEISVEELLTSPVSLLADRWRGSCFHGLAASVTSPGAQAPSNPG
ncbi:MAG: SIS domain-containing protein [Solirubrobacteraceae bacterium]